MRKRGEVCDKRSQKRCTIPEVLDDNGEVVRNQFFCVGCMGTFSITEGNRHHVLEHTLGGLSEKFNVLMVCSSCHVVLHNGTREDRKRIWRRVYSYMGSRYGMLFLLQWPTYYNGVKADLAASPMTLKEIRKLNEWIKDQLDHELVHQVAPGVLHVAPDKPYESVFPK